MSFPIEFVYSAVSITIQSEFKSSYGRRILSTAETEILLLVTAEIEAACIKIREGV